MPFLAEEHLPIPAKDIISWCYDGRDSFDQDKPIYIDCANPSRTISANQAYTLIRKLVAGFRAAGLEKGDVVCIHSFNNLYYPILVQGIVASGGVFVGTNPSYTPFELTHALKTSKAKFVIAEPEMFEVSKQTALQLGIPKAKILLFVEPPENPPNLSTEHNSWRTLLTHGSQDWLHFNDLQTAQDTPAFLMFSSGTTGLPKAAIQSHYNIIAQHTLVHENPAHLESYHLSRIVCMPMFHTAIGPYTHATTLRSGRESYIMRRFALPDFLQSMRRFQVTTMILVPPQVVAIVNAAAQNESFVRQCLASVEDVDGGAAPLDPETQGKLQRLLRPDATFTQVWAMTETTCLACQFYHPDHDSCGGSVGRFMPNLDVKLVDPDPDSEGKEVGPYDTRGELCIRGPTVIKGYLDNPEANARDWDAEGYFHTGDIVFCDSKTELWYVVDRRKELIKVRGFQVAPNEIEGVLLSHPRIKDAAVIGIPDLRAGSELPRAYVVVDAEARAEAAAGTAEGMGVNLTEDEVKGWVGKRLAGFKRLEGGVRFVEAIPKTVSGKILKRVLREEAAREVGLGAKL